MKLLHWILLVLGAGLLIACTSAAASQPAAGVVGQKVSVDGGTYTDISVAELQSMLAHKDFTFVNVHIPFEGNIATTDLSMPYDEIEPDDPRPFLNGECFYEVYHEDVDVAELVGQVADAAANLDRRVTARPPTRSCVSRTVTR